MPVNPPVKVPNRKRVVVNNPSVSINRVVAKQRSPGGIYK